MITSKEYTDKRTLSNEKSHNKERAYRKALKYFHKRFVPELSLPAKKKNECSYFICRTELSFPDKKYENMKMWYICQCDNYVRVRPSSMSKTYNE